MLHKYTLSSIYIQLPGNKIKEEEENSQNIHWKNVKQKKKHTSEMKKKT